MTDERTPEQLIAAANAAYAPFLPFAEWASCAVDYARLSRVTTPFGERPNDDKQLRRAFELVRRAAAIDTGALEGLYETDRGFTFTAAVTGAVLEAGSGDAGSTRARLIQSQIAAYEYVLDFATGRVPVGEAWIRQLHSVICASQDSYAVQTAVGQQQQELPKGRYKTAPNHVQLPDGRVHSYAPVVDTPTEMERLCNELSSATFIEAHPVLQAAFAHYAFVWIHPFADGNGRVARALASIYTLRDYSLPILILADHKAAYLDALRATDLGERQRFVDFVLARTIDAALVVEESLRAASAGDAGTIADSLRRLYVTRGGFTHAAVDEAGVRLLEAMNQKLNARLDPMLRPFAGGVTTLQKIGATDRKAMNDKLRSPVGNTNGFQMQVNTPAPAQAQLSFIVWVEVPIDGGHADDVVLTMEPTIGSEPFRTALGDLVPALSPVAELRLDLFVESVTAEILGRLAATAENSLRQKGY
jgi:Fic family protein